MAEGGWRGRGEPSPNWGGSGLGLDSAPFSIPEPDRVDDRRALREAETVTCMHPDARACIGIAAPRKACSRDGHMAKKRIEKRD
jgi:hypothetical protein